MRRTNSFSNWEALHNVWTAAEVIKAAGYPLEQHTVITDDGYKLRMERLPRTGAPWMRVTQMPLLHLPRCSCSFTKQQITVVLGAARKPCLPSSPACAIGDVASDSAW